MCCGYGEQTLNLFKLLEEKGVAIEKVIGYDVSPEMIAIAQKTSVAESKFHFSLKNVETELKDVEEFDVVTSFFGLHWMNDINKAAELINHSLKPKGLLLTFTPLNIPELD